MNVRPITTIGGGGSGLAGSHQVPTRHHTRDLASKDFICVSMERMIVMMMIVISTPLFRCSLPTAMSISRSGIFRKKRKRTENEKLLGDHGRSMGGHVRSVGVMGGQ